MSNFLDEVERAIPTLFFFGLPLFAAAMLRSLAIAVCVLVYGMFMIPAAAFLIVFGTSLYLHRFFAMKEALNMQRRGERRKLPDFGSHWQALLRLSAFIAASTILAQISLRFWASIGGFSIVGVIDLLFGCKRTRSACPSVILVTENVMFGSSLFLLGVAVLAIVRMAVQAERGYAVAR